MTVVSLDEARRNKGIWAKEGVDVAMPRLITERGVPWLPKVWARIEELMSLDPDWDGYNGRPVSIATAVFALDILGAACGGDSPRPDIMPGSGGDLLIEWENGPKLLQVHVRAPNDVCVYRRDDASDLQEEELIRNDISRVAEWLEWLVGDGGDARAAAEG